MQTFLTLFVGIIGRAFHSFVAQQCVTQSYIDTNNNVHVSYTVI